MKARERILEAAREEFLNNGYDATSMRCIAEKADINKGLLHYYFKTKDALIIQVFAETFSELFSILDKIFDNPSGIEEKIGQVVNEYMSFMLKRQRLPLFILNELDRDPEQHIQRLKKAKVHPPMAKLVRILEEGKKAGHVRNDLDTKQFILNMISLMLFPFVGKPMLKFLHQMDEKSFLQTIEQRKPEITDLLIKSLTP
ncbi:MAG: TetR/AcrR family transcriptional regulator [Cryomorphaceae bacterium]